MAPARMRLESWLPRSRNIASRSAASSLCPPAKLSCAIYPRKSSEEGLEQDFNALDAQRESCEAFSASQKREGWALVGDMYDDGGGQTEEAGSGPVCPGNGMGDLGQRWKGFSGVFEAVFRYGHRFGSLAVAPSARSTRFAERMACDLALELGK